ncbi:ribonuclease HII [Pyrolobus fumarii 1A]|uniref:Ribonuclease n=1 Tax=Pyrolobus fumarii (strain DSM 11204 / 1A) TaxID=694429 RepID=G0ECR7_PYRF1|nr:ribonuclease HII [Pyrolobus fumarii]AEM39637.1 ribonuclease HII [Pyrolobus fumarii 1A]
MKCSAIVMGVDEAGRGPIIGPMVIAGVAMCTEDVGNIRLAGVDDSKLLSRAERERLLSLIERSAVYVGRVYVHPRLIDEVNLNVIERNTIAFLVGRAMDILGESLKKVYVDAVGDPRQIIAAIRRAGFMGEVIAEPKADARYTIVGAASIIAKVYRDAVIEELRREYGVRGSGYPTDPETLAWIREAYEENPEEPPWFVRRSWGTLKRIAPRWYRSKRGASSGQKTLLDYMRGS